MVIEIEAEEDLVHFVDSQMSKIYRFIAGSMRIGEELKSAVANAVHGNFLLAELVCDVLQDTTSMSELSHAWRRLLEKGITFDNAYEESMDRIKAQPPRSRLLAESVFSWLIYAKRPLRASELRHALAVERGTTGLDRENILNIHLIISVCAQLVTVGEQSQIVSLNHHTTHSYFKQAAVRWLPDAHCLIAKSCTTYLSLDAFGSDSQHANVENRLQEYPLYEYAALEWGHHAREVSPPTEGLMSFLMGSQNKLEYSFECVWSKLIFAQFKRSPKNISGLHLAAYFGLEEASTTIIESSGTEIDINIKDSLHFTPLSYAAMGGRDDFIAWLLSKGEVLANSERDSFGLTAINIAAILGHIAGVSRFIKIGTADLDSKDNWGQTPLANAALRGHVEIVRVLVETNRVDVNSQDELEQTPLSSAAEHGQVEVVNFLLENREVDPNAVDLYGKTPLHHALAESMEETVRYLLDSGKVDISLSVKGEDNSTPLESALMEFGEEDSITKLLVDRMEAVGINTEAVIQLWKDDVKLYSYSSSDDTHET